MPFMVKFDMEGFRYKLKASHHPADSGGGEVDSIAHTHVLPRYKKSLGTVAHV